MRLLVVAVCREMVPKMLIEPVCDTVVALMGTMGWAASVHADWSEHAAVATRVGSSTGPTLVLYSADDEIIPYKWASFHSAATTAWQVMRRPARTCSLHSAYRALELPIRACVLYCTRPTASKSRSWRKERARQWQAARYGSCLLDLEPVHLRSSGHYYHLDIASWLTTGSWDFGVQEGEQIRCMRLSIYPAAPNDHGNQQQPSSPHNEWVCAVPEWEKVADWVTTNYNW
jgi:hypothetical protein